MGIIKWPMILIIILAISFCLFNYLTLKLPVNNTIKEDTRNEGVKINVHYKYFILPNIVVFNISSLSGDNSAIDVFRVFLNTASSLKKKEYNKVELSSKGKTKFFIKGSYFKELGEEFGTQNVVYTTRTFPENLYLPDGTVAYQQWSGGLLGVLNKQMEDFNDACNKWFKEDY